MSTAAGAECDSLSDDATPGLDVRAQRRYFVFERLLFRPCTLDGRLRNRGLAVVAVAVPMLMSFTLPPSAIAVDKPAACFGRSAWLPVLAVLLTVRDSLATVGPRTMLGALVFVAATLPISCSRTGVPAPLVEP